MYWRPLWFEADVSVSIGVAVTVPLPFGSRTLSLDIGASAQLWGPPVKGSAHVKCWFISFDISINGGLNQHPARPTRPGQLEHVRSDFAADRCRHSSGCCDRRDAGRHRAAGSTPARRWPPGPRTHSGYFQGPPSLPTRSAVPLEQVRILDAQGAASATVPSAPRRSVSGRSAVAPSRRSPRSAGTCPVPVGRRTIHAGRSRPDGWTWSPVEGAVPAALWGLPLSQPTLGDGAPATLSGVLGVLGSAPAPVYAGSSSVDAGLTAVDDLPTVTALVDQASIDGSPPRQRLGLTPGRSPPP